MTRLVELKLADGEGEGGGEKKRKVNTKTICEEDNNDGEESGEGVREVGH